MIEQIDVSAAALGKTVIAVVAVEQSGIVLDFRAGISEQPEVNGAVSRARDSRRNRDDVGVGDDCGLRAAEIGNDCCAGNDGCGSSKTMVHKNVRRIALFKHD